MKPQMKDLNGGLFGLFPHFKKHSPLIMDARAFADTKWS